MTYCLVEKNGVKSWEHIDVLLDYLAEDWELLAEAPEPISYFSIVGGECIPEMQPYRDEAWARVKLLRQEKYKVAPTTFGEAQSDVESRSFISGLVQMATIAKSVGAPFSETFTMMDNTEVTMNADEMISFGVQVGTYVGAVHSRSRELYAQFQECDTLEDLSAIDIETGWPE